MGWLIIQVSSIEKEGLNLGPTNLLLLTIVTTLGWYFGGNAFPVD